MHRKLLFTLAVWLLASSLLAADKKAKILLIGKDLEHTRLGGTVLFRGPQRRKVEEMLKHGVGITAIHWVTGAETPEGGPWLQTMGGWFNAEGDGFSRYLVQI